MYEKYPKSRKRNQRRMSAWTIIHWGHESENACDPATPNDPQNVEKNIFDDGVRVMALMVTNDCLQSHGTVFDFTVCWVWPDCFSGLFVDHFDQVDAHTCGCCCQLFGVWISSFFTQGLALPGWCRVGNGSKCNYDELSGSKYLINSFRELW